MRTMTEPMPNKYYKQFATACHRYKTRITDQAKGLLFFEVSTEKGRVWDELRG
ncbi:hypothetical protein BH09BAC1_BH09BAC1_17860 [soil metagenome]